MASSLTAARRRVFTGRRVFVTLVAATGVAFSSLPAVAAPETPETSQEAAALVASRAHDLEVVTEDFNEARVQLEAQQAAAAEAAAEVEAADAAVGQARDKVREVARSAYTGDQLSTLQAVLTSTSADQMLDRVGTLDTIAEHNNGVLGVAQQATEAAAASKVAADEAAVAARTQVDRVAAQQADLQSQIAAYQAEYDRLSAEEQERARQLAEQHAAAQAAEAAAAAEAAQGSGTATGVDRTDRSAPAASRSSRETAAPAPSAPVVASSSAAQTAVDTAMAQRGKPYVWAAAGPGSFDCSGLVQYAYAAAGVSVPHSSRVQASMGRAVSRAELAPGDLIAFYSPVSHIGIYIGNGQMVHAPTSGDVVKVSSIDVMGSITAMRRIAG
jgi:cell wall-associated NlpC family hydrolase